MKHLGLFSGIGGFEEAFRRSGANLVGMCEIEPNARRVLRRHFPNAEIINDVKAISKETFGPIDVITGGFPCQDLSVAGQRKGLAGERSGLWFEFIRIIADYQPRWAVIENVPGLLSSNNGEDLAVILRGLVKLGYCVAWRVFDSQFDGVAQRRQRVFIVASLGSGDAAEILFERDGGAWDSAPSREAGERVTGALAAGAHPSGFNGQDAYNGKLVAGPLRASGPGPSRAGDSRGLDTLIIQPQISHALTAEGADASEDGTGRGTPIVAVAQTITASQFNCNGATAGNNGQPVNLQVVPVRDVAPSLTSNYGKQADNSDTGLGPNLAIAFTERTRAEGRNLETQDELAYALTNPGSGGRTHSRQIAGEFGVRRLTPLECERLQGFPEIENCAIIEVCLDPQKSLANVGNQNHKSLKPVGIADETESRAIAPFVDESSQERNLSIAEPAQSAVHIYCAGNTVEIRSHGKLLAHANSADGSKWPRPYMRPDDFAHLAVGLNLTVARIIQSGEAALLQSGQSSIHLQNGKPLVKLSGSEMTQLAKDVFDGSITPSKLTKSTISSRLNISGTELGLITSCFSVVSAINGCIPRETLSGDSFRIEIQSRVGWTERGDDGLLISDSARYRMLGNAVCLPTVEWIARRILST